MKDPETEEKTVREFVDRALRELLSQSDNMRGLLNDAVSDIAGGFVCEEMQDAKREYFLPDWYSREADLLFEIPYRMADRLDLALVCVLIEHKSRAERLTPLITLIYAVLYWEWQLRQWEAQKKPRDSFLLPPIVPIVLYTGQLEWGTVKTLRELLAEPEQFRIYVPDWQPLFWEVTQRSPEELLKSPHAFVQAMALFRVEKQEQAQAEQVFRQAMQQLGPLFDTHHAHWNSLIRFMVGWALHKRPAQERATWSVLAEQVQTDERRKREVNVQVTTIADEIRAEAIAVGKAQGIAEGEAKGEAKGKSGVLLRWGRKKWGEPDGATLQTLQAITDVARLDRMLDIINDLASWADLLNVS